MSESSPWTWYCRIDGQGGTFDTREERDAAAVQHRDRVCETRNLFHIGNAEAGHLRHVWRYGPVIQVAVTTRA